MRLVRVVGPVRNGSEARTSATLSQDVLAPARHGRWQGQHARGGRVTRLVVLGRVLVRTALLLLDRRRLVDVRRRCGARRRSSDSSSSASASGRSAGRSPNSRSGSPLRRTKLAGALFGLEQHEGLGVGELRNGFFGGSGRGDGSRKRVGDGRRRRRRDLLNLVGTRDEGTRGKDGWRVGRRNGRCARKGDGRVLVEVAKNGEGVIYNKSESQRICVLRGLDTEYSPAFKERNDAMASSKLPTICLRSGTLCMSPQA